jgi:PAS domain S-box-containing protein
MKDKNRTKAQLLKEMQKLRRRLEDLEKTKNESYVSSEIAEPSDERFRMLFQYAPDIIFLIDNKGKIFDINKSAERLLGQKREELIGKSGFALGLLTSGQTKKALKNLAKILRGRSAGPDEYTMKKKDGSLATVEVTSFPLKIKNKKFLLGVARDITKRKKVEETLQQQTHNLGERIKELNCLYELDRIARKKNISTEELFRRAVRLLPKSWQYPEIACSRITFQEQKYKTKNFKRTRWMQKADIVVNGKKAGQVEICYLKEKQEVDEGPFLKEERNLINSFAERLGQIIEQRQNQKALERSEERLRMIFEYAPDAYYLNDVKGRLVDGNKAAEKITGYKRNELIGKSFLKLKLLPPEYIPKAASLLAQNMRGRPTGPDEFYLVRKDGKRIPVEIRTYPVKIEGKTMVLGIARDITERKKAEREIKKMSSAVEQSIDGIAVGDLEPRLTDVNDAFARMHGYSIKEMVGMKVEQLHNGEQMEEYKKGMHMIKTQGFWEGEIGHVRKDGTVFPTYMSVTLLNDEHGNPTGIIAICRDITERRKAEKALRESEEKFRSLAEQSPNIIFINKKWKIVYANKRCEEIMGYKRNEYYSPEFDFLCLIAPEYKDLVKKNYHRHLNGEELSPYEYVLVTKEGKRIEALNTSKLINYEGDIAILGIVTDITELKRREEDVRKRKNHLELVHRIQNEIPMNMDVETILKAAAESIGKSFGYNKVSVNILDKDKNELEYIVGWHKSGTPTPRGHRQKVGEGLIGRAARLKRTIIANDVTKEPSYIVYYQAETESELSIPLLVEDNLVGILDVQDTKKNVFTDEDVSVLQSIANYLSYVIDEKQIMDQIKTSLDEKEVLLREIHHRVKNNLQVISSLLSLQSHQIKGKKNLEMFKESQDRVRSMALIHEKLYQSQDLARINFKEYIQTLAAGLFHSYRASPDRISLKLGVEDISLGVDSAIPCGLIVNELVSNSLKHAFPDGKEGEIRVLLHPVNRSCVELVVSDNGVGLPEDLDVRRSKSLGLHLVTILAEDQLQGEVKLKRDKGTEFRIKLSGVKQ